MRYKIVLTTPDLDFLLNRPTGDMVDVSHCCDASMTIYCLHLLMVIERRNSIRLNVKKTDPSSATFRKSGQTVLKSAPRNTIAWAKARCCLC